MMSLPDLVFIDKNNCKAILKPGDIIQLNDYGHFSFIGNKIFLLPGFFVPKILPALNNGFSNCSLGSCPLETSIADILMKELNTPLYIAHNK
ncbi:MAG: hypothetical protein ABI760_25040 [Ferruginibacter sp.]